MLAPLEALLEPLAGQLRRHVRARPPRGRPCRREPGEPRSGTARGSIVSSPHGLRAHRPTSGGGRVRRGHVGHGRVAVAADVVRQRGDNAAVVQTPRVPLCPSCSACIGVGRRKSVDGVVRAKGGVSWERDRVWVAAHVAGALTHTSRSSRVAAADAGAEELLHHRGVVVRCGCQVLCGDRHVGVGGVAAPGAAGVAVAAGGACSSELGDGLGCHLCCGCRWARVS